jgi:hypothetical protein
MLTDVLSKNRKKTNDHYHCPTPVFILMTSKLEATQENHRCSLKLSKRGVGRGLLPVPLVRITIASGRWNGAQDGREVVGGGGLHTTDNSTQQSHIPLSLPFSLLCSLSFFPLCIRQGFDKNTRIGCAEHASMTQVTDYSLVSMTLVTDFSLVSMTQVTNYSLVSMTQVTICHWYQWDK